MKYIIDTNFIIRYLIADNKEQFIKAKEIFDQAKSGQISIILEQTVFTETIFVLNSFYKVPREKICTILSELLTYKGIKCEKEILLRALKIYQDENLHIVDSVLLSKSKNEDISILTFDEKLKSLTGIM